MLKPAEARLLSDFLSTAIKQMEADTNMAGVSIAAVDKQMIGLCTRCTRLAHIHLACKAFSLHAGEAGRTRGRSG